MKRIFTFLGLALLLTGNIAFARGNDDPLAVVKYAPEDGATNVMRGETVIVEFNNEITLVVPSPATITINETVCTATLIPGNKSLRINPPSDDFYQYGETYTVTIPVGNIVGYDQAITWSFTTVPPELISKQSTTPEDWAGDIAIDAVVSIEFDKAIDTNGAPDLSLITLQQDGVNGGLSENLITADDITVSADKKTITINHAPFAYGAPHVVKVPKAAIIGLKNTVELNFTTVEEVLAITAYSPVENATGVALDASVSVTFNRNPHRVGGGVLPPVFPPIGFSPAADDPEVATIKVKATGELVADVVASVGFASNILTIDHAAFAYNTEYEVNIPVGHVIQADDYTTPITWTFTTASEPISKQSTTPEDWAGDIAIDAVVSIEFDKAIDTNGAPDLSLITLQQDGVNGGLSENLITADDITVSVDKKTITINHAPFAYGAPHVVKVPKAAIIGLKNTVELNFTTVEEVLAITAYSPVENATGVALDASVSVTFNRNPHRVGGGVLPPVFPPIGFSPAADEPESVTIKVKETGESVADVVPFIEIGSKILTIDHAAFAYNTEYEVNIPVGSVIQADDYTEPITWSFTTQAPLEVAKYIPEDGATNVMRGETVIVEFNNVITLVEPSPATITINETVCTATLLYGSKRLRINPPSDDFYQYGETYTVVIPAGNIVGYDEAITWSFTVEQALAPVTMSPEDGAENVAIDAAVSVVYNKNIIGAPMAAPPVTIVKKSDNTPVGNVSYTAPAPMDPPTNTLEITHADFEYDTEYVVTIPAGVLVGSFNLPPVTWSFTTGAPLSVVKYTPEDGATNVMRGETVIVEFNNEITLVEPSPATITINETVCTATLMYGSKRLRISPPSDDFYQYGETYTVTIPAGNIVGYDQAITWSFTVEPALAPVTMSPEDGAENVAIDAAVSVVYNKNIIGAPMAAPPVTIVKKSDNTPVGNVSYTAPAPMDPPTNTLEITHADFEYDTEYVVTIPAGVLVGSFDLSPVTWSFTTESSLAVAATGINASSVYPTLSGGKIYVNSAPRSTVSVMDIYGKTIAVYTTSGETLELNLNYAAGIYLILINDGTIATHKVILQK